MFQPFAKRYLPLTFAVLTAMACTAAMAIWPSLVAALSVPLAVVAALAMLGFWDLLQTHHAVLRNYLILAHLRFLLEQIRSEMRQYFFEDEKSGTPFARDKRALVYQRAKRQLDKRPFGTQYDVYGAHFEWLNHWHQTHKNRILLENYYLPGDLEQKIGDFVAYCNHLRY